MAISKGIVEEHGGSIGFNTEIGKGTEFWFELPDTDETKPHSSVENVSTVLAAEKAADENRGENRGEICFVRFSTGLLTKYNSVITVINSFGIAATISFLRDSFCRNISSFAFEWLRKDSHSCNDRQGRLSLPVARIG